MNGQRGIPERLPKLCRGLLEERRPPGVVRDEHHATVLQPQRLRMPLRSCHNPGPESLDRLVGMFAINIVRDADGVQRELGRGGGRRRFLHPLHQREGHDAS